MNRRMLKLVFASLMIFGASIAEASNHLSYSTRFDGEVIFDLELSESHGAKAGVFVAHGVQFFIRTFNSGDSTVFEMERPASDSERHVFTFQAKSVRETGEVIRYSVKSWDAVRPIEVVSKPLKDGRRSLEAFLNGELKLTYFVDAKRNIITATGEDGGEKFESKIFGDKKGTCKSDQNDFSCESSGTLLNTFFKNEFDFVLFLVAPSLTDFD
jgi:hypothetical protein